MISLLSILAFPLELALFAAVFSEGISSMSGRGGVLSSLANSLRYSFVMVITLGFAGVLSVFEEELLKGVEEG